MRTPESKQYTIRNNVQATHNVCLAVASFHPSCHIVHLGTMGVYGYGTAGAALPEGYIDVLIPSTEAKAGLAKVGDGEKVSSAQGEFVKKQIVYPPAPGSLYHMTKVLD